MGKSMMDKKPIIRVSICSVVLLVLASLSNVVGYQSIKSTAVNDSPLFSVRTKRAINEENKSILTFNYLGKGQYPILIPQRDNEAELVRKFIDKIRAMDDDTFNKFIGTIINQINHRDNLKDIDVKESIKGLRQLRENPQNNIVYKETDNANRTYFHDFYITACWFPGCIIFLVFWFIIVIILNIIFLTVQTCSAICLGPPK